MQAHSDAPTACRHTVSGTISLRSRGTFHHSLTVLSAIGHQGIFRLSGWSRQIHTGFLGPRATWEIRKRAADVSTTGVLPSTPDLSHVLRLHQRFLTLRPAGRPIKCTPTTPTTQPLPGLTRRRFSLIRFRSPLLPESRLFSLPAGTEMFHFPAFPPRTLCVQMRVTRQLAPLAGFPHSDTLGSQSGYRLPQAYRRFLRPSSAPNAKASTVCS